MKRFFFLSGTICCLLFSGSSLHAQQNIAPAKGQFEINTGAREKVLALYRLSPAYPDNILLEINPSAPFPLRASVVNEKGAEQFKLKAEEVTLRYANSIDISKLKKGSYFIEVYPGRDKQQVIRIPFTK